MVVLGCLSFCIQPCLELTYQVYVDIHLLFMWVEKVSNDFGLHDNFYIHEIKLILDYACSVVEVAYTKFQSVNKFKIHGIS
jgi:hypothetical protein